MATPGPPVPNLSLPTVTLPSPTDESMDDRPSSKEHHVDHEKQQHQLQHHHHHDNHIAAEPKGYWAEWQTRAGTVSLLFSLLMQLSYVAFPAYNFSLAIWATVHPFSNRHTKTNVLFVSVMLLSCGTDVVWSSLWTSGAVFYDMLCSPAQIGILHCDGLQSYPGCATNRFVMVLFVANIATKLWIAISIWKAVAVAKPEVVPTAEAMHLPPPPGTNISDAPTAIPVE
ncbi:hypothetical protein H257_02600 [Aphanomyces astaci]|uniref:Uncharacterized protein n=1 Tax=Aphanomyces astaci TaxID=112090 RepID=W4H2P9_APHAT|nr:hypothetical protein H257_02600 [Aphanomyces astaci]ETV86142.1 hypothetical protein H257_02600 [Aphanomyces astaci]RQM28043.1 hypothetical protein B5M09_000340 [Aphanomyces astaci]|eukprot:XP_009824614.1 hypothetical protein H257_02600 [Aphanomyces astaci]